MTLLTQIGAVTTAGNTLLDLETPEDPASANIIKDGTEETTLLTRGGQEVSGLDSISHEEEDDLLSSTLQEARGENPIEGVSIVELWPFSSTELMGSPPTKGADPPAEPSSSVKASECTTTLALTLEHQAEVHSADTIVQADTVALTTSWGLPFIKPKPIDPPPVKFTGKLWVINDELEIIDFVPAQEVCHTGCKVKQEPPECAPCFPQAASCCQAIEELQEWSYTPNPMMEHVGADMSDPPTLQLMTVNLPPQGQFYPLLLPPVVPPQCLLPFHRT